jgi:hypothetical protein
MNETISHDAVLMQKAVHLIARCEAAGIHKQIELVAMVKDHASAWYEVHVSIAPVVGDVYGSFPPGKTDTFHDLAKAIAFYNAAQAEPLPGEQVIS